MSSGEQAVIMGKAAKTHPTPPKVKASAAKGKAVAKAKEPKAKPKPKAKPEPKAQTRKAKTPQQKRLDEHGFFQPKQEQVSPSITEPEVEVPNEP